MTKPFSIGIPSKGRLKERTLDILAAAGYRIIQPNGGRSYIGKMEDHQNIEVQFLAASEIASELGNGHIHIGITGQDLIAEKIPDHKRKITIGEKLGFGHADVIIAVPEAWIDVESLEDLEEIAGTFRARHQRSLRVATKFVQLTRHFFSTQNIVDYQIIGSLGATEGAPANGFADIIVDITSTGDTLKANGLKVLRDGIILKSQAVLAVSQIAEWNAQHQSILNELKSKIIID